MIASVPGARAGDLTVVGNLGVASNLTAQAVILGGVLRTNWPSGGSPNGATVLTTAVLDFTQPGQFFQYTLTSDTAWNFTNHVAGRQVWLQVTQDPSGGWQNSWPPDLLWSSGQAANVTATANHFSVVRILDNGSSWLVQAEGLDFSVPCLTNCNYALQFDGSQNYVEVPADTAFDTVPFTIEFWAKGGAGYNSLGDDLDNANDGWSVESLYLKLDNSPDGFLYTSFPTDGGWHHYAWTVSADTVTGYLDGSLVANAYNPQSWSGTLNSGGTFKIGRNFRQFSACTFDEVRFSSIIRYTNDFSASLPCDLTNDSYTVALWKFNEGSGTTAYDSSSNGCSANLFMRPDFMETG